MLVGGLDLGICYFLMFSLEVDYFVTSVYEISSQKCHWSTIIRHIAFATSKTVINIIPRKSQNLVHKAIFHSLHQIDSKCQPQTPSLDKPNKIELFWFLHRVQLPGKDVDTTLRDVVLSALQISLVYSLTICCQNVKFGKYSDSDQIRKLSGHRFCLISDSNPQISQ